MIETKDSIQAEMKSLCVGVKVPEESCGSVYKVAFCTFKAITCICGPSVRVTISDEPLTECAIPVKELVSRVSWIGGVVRSIVIVVTRVYNKSSANCVGKLRLISFSCAQLSKRRWICNSDKRIGSAEVGICN